MTSREKINEITGRIVDAAMKVHTVYTVLGPGLLESAYEACLAYELDQRGLKVHSQVELPVIYENIRIDVGYRCDLLVEDTVIVELKAVEKVTLFIKPSFSRTSSSVGRRSAF